VGDRGVGKTALVKKFVGEDFIKPISACYATPVKHVKTITVDNKKVKYTIHESSDATDPVSSSQLREADVIMLCFNICDPPTLASAIQTWVPALPPAPLLLVGCQADLRTDRIVLASLTRLGQSPVTANQAMFFTRQGRLSCTLRQRPEYQASLPRQLSSWQQKHVWVSFQDSLPSCLHLLQ